MGRGKKQKVGNRYYYGVHLIPCRKADAILAIRMADKVVWEGEQGDGFVNIHAPDAFGGDEREGGFSGRIAVMEGKPDQLPNTYLSGIFGNLTPAFRGVFSLVFERPYFNANSARLPLIQTKQINVDDIHKGWLTDLAVVDIDSYVSGAAIYIAMDVSLSMAGARLTTQAAALAGFVRGLKGSFNSIRVVAHSGTINASFQRLDCEDDDYEEIAQWIENYTTLVTGGNWANAVSQAAEFFTADDTVVRRLAPGGILANLSNLSSFLGLGGEVKARKRRVIIFTTDGIPSAGTPETAAATIASIGGVEVYAFNIVLSNTTETAKLDNTPRDGVPVVSGTNPQELRLALGNAFRRWVDLNPAHIQRCLLIDRMRGGTASPGQIGDTFAQSAQEYFDEGFGLSVRFSGAAGNLKDRMEIDRHCDAVTYRSRRTGKWEHVRIRDNFDFNDLPVLDAKLVKDWTRLRRPKRRELPNKLTVLYTDRTNGKSASITKSNPVGVRAVGRVVQAQDARYPYVSIPRLAERLCVRDLVAAETPLLAGDLPLSYLPADLEFASAVRLHAPGEGIDNVPVRVTEIRHAGGTDASVWLKVIEHRFDLGAGVALPDPGEIVTIDDRPKVAQVRMVEEAPYYVLALQLGQGELDARLSDEPGAARLLVAAAKPNARHLEAVVGVSPTDDWQEDGLITFSAAAVTTAPLLQKGDATELRVAPNSSLSEIEANQLALIGSEIIRIDAMAEDAGDIVLTIGRACLDTAPGFHTAGSPVLFFGPGELMETVYLHGETINAIILPRTATDTLSISRAPVDTVTFSSRAARPYPPGRFKLNGSYEQDQFTSDVALSWAHRDRTLQTTPVPEDHDDGDIGPEPGVTYRVRAEALSGSGAVLGTVTDTNVGSTTSYDWNDATVLPSGTVRVRFSVAAVRDGYESWQRPAMTIRKLLPPGSLTAEVL